MEVLIFSDSHGRTDGMRLALSLQRSRPAAVIHLGDGVRDAEALDLNGIPLYTVRGNCDFRSEFFSGACPEECLTSIGGHLALMTHGARYGVKGGLERLLSYAAQKGADFVLYGHTHRSHLEVLPVGTEIGGVQLRRPMYVFNPGSIGRNEYGEGLSFGVLTLCEGNVLFSHGRI